GASGSLKLKAPEGTNMKTIAEQITALENKRAASATRMEAVMQKSLDEDRTSDTEEQDEFDTLSGEVEAIDKDLVRLRKIEQAKAFAAKAVTKADTAREGAEIRGNSIIVKTLPVFEPGIELARRVKVKIMSRVTSERAADVAAMMYGSDSEVAAFYKAAVPAATTITGNWAANLIGAETGGAAVAAFLEYLRPRTIL